MALAKIGVEVIGAFEETVGGNYFEFSDNPDKDMEFLEPELRECPHIIWVTHPIDGIDSGFRYATVKKTVAYIATDYDAFGNVIFEKWSIKKHTIFPK